MFIHKVDLFWVMRRQSRWVTNFWVWRIKGLAKRSSRGIEVMWNWAELLRYFVV